MDSLDRERRLVGKATLVGSLLLIPCGAMLAAILCVYIYAFLTVRQTAGQPLSWWALMLCDAAIDLLSTLAMQVFLWHFSRDAEPFDDRQSRRLLFTGVLFVIKTILSGYIRPFDNILVSEGPLPIELAYTGVRIGPLSMAVFVICIALVLRYGNALKEDSDSFV